VEFIVLETVYERVEATVEEHGDHGEVVEPAGEVGIAAEKIQQDEELVARRAQDKSTADDDERFQYVTFGLAVCCRGCNELISWQVSDRGSNLLREIKGMVIF
jgi:hypothetical protein